MPKPRKILAVTGIRSEYDILFPVIDGLRKSKAFDLQLVVSGAHLSDWHGQTVKRIQEDGFTIADKIDSLLMTNRKVQRVKGVGLLTSALAQTVERVKPDILLVVGDREESIAAALVGNYMDVLVAHLGGGDTVYGNADDPIRFAVSKLANIHFTFSEQSSKVLHGIGEEKFRIFNSGNPAIDKIRAVPSRSMERLARDLEFGIRDRKYLVLLKHPLSSTKEKSFSQMKLTLDTLRTFAVKHNLKIVGIYPNTDPGSYDIVKAINAYQKEDWIKFYKNLPRELFVNVMRHSLALVGNSSMGILEAPFYKLPVVNIGNRQLGRFQAGNVVFVDYGAKKITQALEKAVFDLAYRQKIRRLPNPFGNGTAAEKIKKALLSISLKDHRWYIKKLV